MRYSDKKVEASRNFANKLWNATRFVLMNLPEDFTPGLPSEDKLDMSDKWVLTKLNQVAGAMTDNLDHYEMGLAAAKINSFIWDVYCDWFIEIAKPRLNSGDAEQADTARRVLVYVLDKALKLLHPFMPFITEELYQALPGSAETIMTQSWPTFDEAHNWADEEEAFEKVMDYIKAVRTMRTEMNVHPAKKTSMIIETADAAPFRNAQVYLAKFAFATDVTFTEKYEGSTDGMVQVSTHAARGFIPMMELIDRDKELARLNKEKAKAEKELAMFENQLANPKFVERAPAALVEEIRAKMAAAAREAGRDPAQVQLCAACKTRTAETVAASAALPIDVFGENHVQELCANFDAGAYCGKPSHFIGHLQTNKIKKVLGRASLIQSVDSEHLLNAIEKEAAKAGIVQNVLLEVNIGGEESKTGVAPEALWPLLDAAAAQEHIRVKGLMAIPPVNDDDARNRRYLAEVYKLFVQAGERGYSNVSMETLSMGMSGDFENAIREGATLVRIGTAIYGERDYSKKR